MYRDLYLTPAPHRASYFRALTKFIFIHLPPAHAYEITEAVSGKRTGRNALR